MKMKPIWGFLVIGFELLQRMTAILNVNLSWKIEINKSMWIFFQKN